MKKAWLVIASLLTLVACGTLPPPVVQPPIPIPGISRVAQTVLTETRMPVAALSCEISPDLASGGAGTPCDYSSGIQAVYSLPASLDQTGATVRYSAEGYESVEQRVVISSDLSEVTMHPSWVKLPRLVPVGQFLQREGGEPWTVIGASSFNLLNRFANGEDVRPVMAQLQSIGFNAIRVWTAYDICPLGAGCQKIGRLVPSPGTYAAAVKFAQLASRYGLYVEYTAFTGPYGVIPTDDAKIAHWNGMVAVAMDATATNVMLEMVNEYDNSPNLNIPYARLNRPPTAILASHGSASQDALPLQAFWSYITYRPGGGSEWMRKVGHNAWEDVGAWANAPVISNETTRAPDQDNNPNHFYDAAMGATAFSAGAYFHSVHGKAGELLDGTEESLARAWVAGARSYPLGCRGQQYFHLNDGPYLRLYRFGGDSVCLVPIRF